ncbi:MAG: cobalt-factor II C(20)-methyltransferase [Methanosarcinales archaeon]|jgi:precorrin-2/cobalt-factor-2 C20-methyltransferase|nr:cobalt-factor II C(20)-methyltransferase [Methanosarcinales archaeon]
MLIGVGLGPGDPELITLKTIKVLKNSEKVFVPGKLAEKLVSPYADSEILDFPMIRDIDALNKKWIENANIVAKYAKNHTVAFGVIGDPCLFSTFTHLKRVMNLQHPDIEVITIPGISSITSFASRADVEIDSSYIVYDGSKINHKIVLKAINPKNIMDLLKKEGFNDFTFLERLFSKNEIVLKNDKIPDKGNYFSIVYAKK